MCAQNRGVQSPNEDEIRPDKSLQKPNEDPTKFSCHFSQYAHRVVVILVERCSSWGLWLVGGLREHISPQVRFELGVNGGPVRVILSRAPSEQRVGGLSLEVGTPSVVHLLYRSRDLVLFS